MKITRSLFYKNQPVLMLGAGLTGIVTTVFLAIKGHGKAIEHMNWDDGGELYKTNKKGKRVIRKGYWIKNTWKYYIPTIVVGSLSVCCLVASYSINQRRNAALASSLAISEAAMTNYQKHVVDAIGEEAERGIRDSFEKSEIAKAEMAQRKLSSKEEARYLEGDGTVNCYESTTQRKFWSSKEDIKRAVNNLNQERLTGIGTYVTLNDFYRELNLTTTTIGDLLGWNLDTPVEVSISAIEDNGIPCLYIKPMNLIRV